MKFTITINCDNAAFTDCNIGPEVARILADLAGRFNGPIGGNPRGMNRKLYDANGNECGKVVVTA